MLLELCDLVLLILFFIFFYFSLALFIISPLLCTFGFRTSDPVVGQVLGRSDSDSHFLAGSLDGCLGTAFSFLWRLCSLVRLRLFQSDFTVYQLRGFCIISYCWCVLYFKYIHYKTSAAVPFPNSFY